MPQPGPKIGGLMVEVQDRTRGRSSGWPAPSCRPCTGWPAGWSATGRGPGPGGVAARLPVLRDPQAGCGGRALAQVHPGQCVPRPAPPPGPLAGGAAGGPGGGLLAVPDPDRTRPAALFRHPAPRLSAGVRQGGRPGGAPAPARALPGPAGAAYMDGFATKEIARLLDVPLGTVLARLHRGRKFEQELWTYAQETGLLLKGTVR